MWPAVGSPRVWRAKMRTRPPGQDCGDRGADFPENAPKRGVIYFDNRDTIGMQNLPEIPVKQAHRWCVPASSVGFPGNAVQLSEIPIIQSMPVRERFFRAIR